MAAETSRTTLTLPTELPRAIDRAVHEGQARSRGELVAAALRRELAIRERAAMSMARALTLPRVRSRRDRDSLPGTGA
jgi:metal-responsive CopG/Arc/MetJ family transcriptional regulator